MSFIQIIILALLLFIVYPTIITSFAPERTKLGVFVSAIFMPLFTWIALYMSLNTLFISTGNWYLQYSSFIWIGMYLSLQVIYAIVLQKYDVVAEEK